MSKSLFIVIGVFLLTAIILNVALDNPTFIDLTKKAEYYNKTNKPRDAEKCYVELLQTDSNNIETHYGYIHSHYNIPKREKVGKNNWIDRDDNTIRDYYTSRTQTSDKLQHDFGYYGLGLCASMEDNYPYAMTCYDSVCNKQLKYLNNSIGYIYNHDNDLTKAEKYFRTEIDNKGNLSGAYSNLIDVLLKGKKFDELNKLIGDTATNKYFSYNEERNTYFLQGQISNYFKTIFSRFTGNINSFGFLGAVIILPCWLLFLRQIDVYENEKWKYIILTCGLGMIFTFGTYLITDLIHEHLHFELNGNVLNDFFYAIFGIGAVEEFVKFLPLLIMLLFTKEVNEPIDYIIYASVSAIGFSFVENLMYFNEGSLFIIHGRALSSVISHMFDASVVAYGLILCRYKNHGNIYVSFFLSFLVAAFAHGFYDFWLVNDYVSDFSFITFFFMIFTFVWYNIFISNALNNSTFFDRQKIVDAEKLKDYLFYSLSSVILLEYLIMSIKFGPSAGNWTLFKSVYSGAYLIFFLSTSLSNFQVKQGEWRPLFDWLTKGKKDY
jgi:RsiW-degrading membrane proteinase PrsW (M82 family)